MQVYSGLSTEKLNQAHCESLLFQMYFTSSACNRFRLHRRGPLAVSSPPETVFPPPLLIGSHHGAQKLLGLSNCSTRITSHGNKNDFPVRDVITVSAKLTNGSLWMFSQSRTYLNAAGLL